MITKYPFRRKAVAESLEDREVFRREEVRANRLTALVILLTALIFGAYFVVASMDLMVNLNSTWKMGLSLSMIILSLIASVVALVVKGRYEWVKYMLLITFIVAAGLDRALRNYYGLLMFMLPIALSIRYLSKYFTYNILLLTNVVLAVSQFIATRIGILDLNMIQFSPGTVLTIPEGKNNLLKAAAYNAGFSMDLYVKNTAVYIVLFNAVELTIVGLVCAKVADFCRHIVIAHAASARKTAANAAELSMATEIQKGMLPGEFPAFPGRTEFDLFALMDPAREVGGDFYDFFFVDDDHLALVIADVSGKGVPAALMMSVTKAMIKNNVNLGLAPDDVFISINEQICKSDLADMFVTSWLGILTVSTGDIVTANAGHEYPAIGRKGEGFTLIKTKHGPPLGYFPGVSYAIESIKLYSGDALFVYTDGVPEATDQNKKMFGEERMLDALDSVPDMEPEGLIIAVKRATDAFVRDNEQFDDLTMLAIQMT